MPMCDAYIPAGYLDPDAEHELIRDVTNLLVEHELRRITDLMKDPEEVKASQDRARSIAWLFLHREQAYVAGETVDVPVYKFMVSIPQGQIDGVFRDSISEAITSAVAKAEDGRWRHIGARVWVITYEVPDGNWGYGRGNVRLNQIVDYVAPGMGELAVNRWAAIRRQDAAATVTLAAEAAIA